jgi:hypothetical protein
LVDAAKSNTDRGIFTGWRYAIENYAAVPKLMIGLRDGERPTALLENISHNRGGF